MTTTETLTGERADLLETLQQHRWFLTFTAQGLTDEQAASTPTVSALSIGGLIKHVTRVEGNWIRFIEEGTSAMEPNADTAENHLKNFHMQPGDTLESVLARYQEVAAYTDKLVETVDLDLAHELPEAPWFPKGKTYTARRVLMHIVAETSQHAGHADIIRETIDGQKTMG
ncbi:DinB family protein [Lentzea sp. BCCO 10_0856]|uniref:DinB family protein n=1 Tax=Lentzea miocenica TaxID=3095431 RepID=A0ABU4T3Y4_9PSEU|nr:DinB family protein [Lentzea sp. BCCO 10_0856]MDX8032883.1 DinB family protein [Lentzea sp. BCCO 10_0856]